MKTREISVIFLLLLTMLIAGCNWTPVPNVPNNSPTPTDETKQSFVTPEENELQIPPTISPNTNLQILIEKARADLAQALSIPASQINFVAAVDVIWPDSSLGCPQSNVIYTQVLTEGFLIRFEAENKFHQYHTDSGEQFILCENPDFPLIPVTPGDIQDGIPWMPVD